MSRFRTSLALLLCFAPLTAHAQDAADNSTSRWLTFKGDTQRTGSSNARVSLPLNLTWRYSSDEPAQSNTSSPLITGPGSLRRVLFSTGNAIYCLEAANGTLLWKAALTGYARAPISLLEGGDGGDLVIATTTNGTINAMRASDGTVLWTAETRAPVGGIAPIPVTLPGGPRLLQATSTGRLLAYGLDGARDAEFSAKLGRANATPTATPTLSRDKKTIFIPAQDKKLYAVSLETGEVSWTAPLRATSYVSPVAAGDAVISQINDELVSVYEADGAAKWRVDLKTPLLAPFSVRTDDKRTTIFVGTTKGTFFALDADTGDTLWQTDVDAPLTGTPLALSNAILVGTRNGLLVALAPSDGKVLWRYRLHTERSTASPRATRTDPQIDAGAGDPATLADIPPQPGADGAEAFFAPPEVRTYPVSSSPAAVDGQIYVVADNAALYALDSTPFDADAPTAVSPAILVRDSEGRMTPRRVSSRRPVLIPGRPPIYFTVEIDDPGSGVDPASIRVSVNGTELPKEKIFFQAATGTLTAILADIDPAKTVVLPDAVYSINLIARDMRGNVLTYSTSFTVDKSVSPPRARRERPTGPDGQPGAF